VKERGVAGGLSGMSEGFPGFPDQLLLPGAVHGGEVKDREMSRPRLPGQASRLGRREMVFLEGALPIFLEERRLDDENGSAGSEFDDLSPVFLAVKGIGHVGDFFARRDPYDAVPEIAEGQADLRGGGIRLLPPDGDFHVIGVIPEEAFLQFREPGAHGKIHGVEDVLFDVKVLFLRHGDGQGRDLVVQEDALDEQVVPVYKTARTLLLFLVVLSSKGAAALVPRRFSAGFAHLGDREPEPVRVIFNEIPGIGPELAFHVGHEAGRAEKGNVLVPAQADAQKMVETDEMIHVGVADETMAHFQELSRGKRGEVPHVEEKGLPAVLQLQVNTGVSERVVYELRDEHFPPCRGSDPSRAFLGSFGGLVFS